MVICIFIICLILQFFNFEIPNMRLFSGNEPKAQRVIARINTRLDEKWLIIRGYGNTAGREGASEG